MFGELTDAHKRFKKSLRLQPHQPSAWAQLAGLQSKLKNQLDFMTALQKASSSPASAARLCVPSRNSSRSVASTPTPPTPFANSPTSHLAPREADVRALLARALMAASEIDEANRMCEQALQLDVSPAAARELLGVITAEQHCAQPELADLSRD